MITVPVTAPEIAMNLCESSLLPEQLECYLFCLGKQYDLANDEALATWKFLKLQCESSMSAPDRVPVSLSVSATDLSISMTSQNKANIVTDIDICNLNHRAQVAR